jgi:signal transduction histidine kinase
MALSLGLLLLFLFLFLKKAYSDELESLKRETSLLFVNSIQGIQGEAFDKLIVHKMEGLPDSTIRMKWRTSVGKPHDSLKVITSFRQEERIFRTQGDSSFKIILRNEKAPTANPDIKGALSVIISMDDKKMRDDSVCLPGLEQQKVLPLLEKNFNAAIVRSGLPVHFQIQRMGADSSIQTKGFLAGTYTDIVSGEQFGLLLSDYQHYIWKQMAPQTLFACFLFAIVTLAFLFIFQTMRQQQRLAEQKNDFIRNVTHELKTPIATVSVAIEALQNFDALQNPARTQEYLDISRMELSRLSLLVDKVLRMSLFEKGEPELKLEPVDLKSLIEEILASMKLQFEKYGAKVGFSTSGADFSLEGDRLHLASVVYNLLDNALKYSPKHPDISLKLEQQEHQLTFQVQDQGRGIPTAYLEKIFEKFFRVPSGDVHNVKGHGLGLSYVAGVVQQHRGAIRVESREGAGACFTITLPK